MAKPRIFVSSTYYDLKHIRSSLDNFVESLGFDPILSEKGDIAYTPDAPLDESCYREVGSADVFVLIVGGRYGSEVSGTDKRPSHKFFERYDSITKKEFEAAVKRDIPIYVLIESFVYSEYQTFIRNKENTTIAYAHVDSVNIFHLIEDILAKPRNNPIHTFDRFADIEAWLREQWSGLFRELLNRRSSQQQIATLSSQVEVLKEINTTLKTYLEAVITKISPDESAKLIQSEEKRLDEVRQMEKLRANEWFKYLRRKYDFDEAKTAKLIEQATSFDNFCKLVGKASTRTGAEADIRTIIDEYSDARRDFNAARQILGKKSLRLMRKGKDLQEDFDEESSLDGDVK